MSDEIPMSITAEALLACYQAHGDCVPGTEVRPLHHYTWTVTRPDDSVEVLPCAWCDHLMNDPNPLNSGWVTADLTTANAIQDCDRDALYLAAGAGRFAKFIESLGRTCHSIDIAPEAIELMTLRGVSSELMDAQAMTFADNSYPLVIVGYGLLGVSSDPAGLMAEAARVASERVIVTDWGDFDEPYSVTEKLEWNGKEQSWVAASYGVDQALQWLADAGAAVVYKKVAFLDNPELTDASWLVEVGF